MQPVKEIFYWKSDQMHDKLQMIRYYIDKYNPVFYEGVSIIPVEMVIKIIEACEPHPDELFLSVLATTEKYCGFHYTLLFNSNERTYIKTENRPTKFYDKMSIVHKSQYEPSNGLFLEVIIFEFDQYDNELEVKKCLTLKLNES